MHMQERTRTLVEIALTVALCAVLNYVKVWQMPQGGSVSLDMLPLFVLALRRGPVVGIVAGVLFGVVDAALEPVVVHPVQFLLDYPVAFGAVGLAGLLSRSWQASMSSGRTARGIAVALVPAVVLGSTARYVAHVTSGVVFFGQYAPEGQPVILYSAIYNSFVFVSAVVCGIAAAAVLPALSKIQPVDRGVRMP